MERHEGLFRDRPITPEEREIVHRLVSPEPVGPRLAYAVLYMVLAATFFYAVYVAGARRHPGSVWDDPAFRTFAVLTIVAWALIAALSAVSFARRRRALARQQREVEADIAEGLVEAARIRPLDLVQLDGPRRRDPSFVFLIDEGTAVLLHLVDVHDEKAELPSTEFEYVRLRNTKHTIRIAACGERINEVKHADGSTLGLDALSQAECEPFPVDWAVLVEDAVTAPVTDRVFH